MDFTRFLPSELGLSLPPPDRVVPHPCGLSPCIERREVWGDGLECLPKVIPAFASEVWDTRHPVSEPARAVLVGYVPVCFIPKRMDKRKPFWRVSIHAVWVALFGLAPLPHLKVFRIFLAKPVKAPGLVHLMTLAIASQRTLATRLAHSVMITPIGGVAGL